MKYRVKTTEVQLHAFSLAGHVLPTFSKGRIKVVRNRWGCTVAKYLFFIELDREILYADPLTQYNIWARERDRQLQGILTTNMKISWEMPKHRFDFKSQNIYKQNYIRVK